jgi:hypothetical protein
VFTGTAPDTLVLASDQDDRLAFCRLQRKRRLDFVEGQNVKLMAAAVVCAMSNFPWVNWALTEGVICRRA